MYMWCEETMTTYITVPVYNFVIYNIVFLVTFMYKMVDLETSATTIFLLF